MTTRMLLTLALFALSAIAESQPTTRLLLGDDDSRLWIEGASNLSGWTCKTTAIDAAIDVDSGFANPSELPAHLRRLTVKVPVAALTCGRAQMDKSLRTALKVDEAPTNAYIIATLGVIGTDERDGRTVHTLGTLAFAGRENAVRLDIDATPVSSGGIEARGEIPILMSDYGVEPPSALFGVIRCADRVVVKFALTITPTVGAVPGSAALPR